MNAKETIKDIILNGTPEEKHELYRFDRSMSKEKIKKKFKLFARGCYPRYFAAAAAPFHDDMIGDMIDSYYGENWLEAAYRGSAKTSLKKLFDVFVLLNDDDHFRKYIKVLTRDLKNSKQIVTDVYNLIFEVEGIYGNVFEKEGSAKREETMTGFVMRDGRKYASGTVGQSQRGHIQDAYRPDWVWFEDVEDCKSMRSMVITQNTIVNTGEAIKGLSINGSYFVTCNYISDEGVIQNFINKPSVHTRITPLLADPDDYSSMTWSVFSEEKVRQIRLDCEKEPMGDFWGEYQCDPKRSENKFFDIPRIEADLKLCTEPDRESAGVKYWSSYKPHHRYGQGSDHSEGKGLDSNALVGFDFTPTPAEQVFSYANNEIAPDLSAYEFARVGAEFGNCLWAPEVNNKCGGIVITTARQTKYPRIFTRQIEDSIEIKETDKLGWETNSATKYTMFFEFRRDYNDGLIRIRDANILREMKAYTKNDLGQTNAGLLTRHFDLLTAAVIAWQMRKHAVAPTQEDDTPSVVVNRDPYDN
jgi:hypothetical protein